jgi:hypothetical protein
MIQISIKDTDIVYPVKTLTCASETEGMTLAEKNAFIDRSIKEMKKDLRDLLFGESSVYDEYNDDMNKADDSEEKIA